MKKLIILILCLLVLSCATLQVPIKNDIKPDLNKMEWTGWYKDKDSINHNILYAPINDSINVIVMKVSY